MDKRILLLSANYEVIAFISIKKAIRLLFHPEEKVEIISTWEDYLTWSSGKIKLPSILRLKRHLKKYINFNDYNKKQIIKRDKCICQYCSKKIPVTQITIDHVIPRALGGNNTYYNCVVCCKDCNVKKGSKTLEQSGMKLIRKPVHPTFSPSYKVIVPQEHWFSGWDDFVNIN